MIYGAGDLWSLLVNHRGFHVQPNFVIPPAELDSKVCFEGVRQYGRLQPGERNFGANGDGKADPRHRALEPRPPRFGCKRTVGRGTVPP